MVVVVVVLFPAAAEPQVAADVPGPAGNRTPGLFVNEPTPMIPVAASGQAQPAVATANAWAAAVLLELCVRKVEHSGLINWWFYYAHEVLYYIVCSLRQPLRLFLVLSAKIVFIDNEATTKFLEHRFSMCKLKSHLQKWHGLSYGSDHLVVNDICGISRLSIWSLPSLWHSWWRHHRPSSSPQRADRIATRVRLKQAGSRYHPLCVRAGEHWWSFGFGNAGHTRPCSVSDNKKTFR